MSLKLLLRSATEGDETAVVALWCACDLVASYNDPVRDFHFALNKPNSDVLIGLALDGKIIGSVLVGHDGHRGWVYYVAADPNYRKQGIGRKMILSAENWLRERNVVKVMLLVRETNLQVIDFYQHLGFETSPRTVMQKWL